MKVTIMVLSEVGNFHSPLVPVVVNAKRTAAPGLVVHRRIVTGENGRPVEGRAADGWVLTHVASGQTIGSPRKHSAQALALAQHLVGIVDWTLPEEVLTTWDNWGKIYDAMINIESRGV